MTSRSNACSTCTGRPRWRGGRVVRFGSAPWLRRGPETATTRGARRLLVPARRPEMHMGVEDSFTPARKAHPALLVTGARRPRRDAVSHGCGRALERPSAGHPALPHRRPLRQPAGVHRRRRMNRPRAERSSAGKWTIRAQHGRLEMRRRPAPVQQRRPPETPFAFVDLLRRHDKS